MVHNKKIAPSNPNLLDFEHVKGIRNSQGRKRTRDHDKREEHKNERDWKWTIRDAREDCPNDKNGDELDKMERDY